MTKENTEVLENTPDTPIDPEMVDGTVETPSPDTETVTAPADTGTETVEPQDEYLKAFKEEGLDSQYRDPIDLIQRTKDTNRYLESLNQTNQAQQRQLEDYQRRIAELDKPKPQPIDPEKFIESFNQNPIDAMRQAGFVSKDEVEKRLTVLQQREAQRDLADAIGEYPELKNVASGFRIGQQPVKGMNQYWDAIYEVAQQYPGIEQAPTATALQVLFPKAKQLVDSRKKPPVSKVPQETKKGAVTTPSGKPGKGGTPDFTKMTAGDIEKYYAERGQVNY